MVPLAIGREARARRAFLGGAVLAVVLAITLLAGASDATARGLKLGFGDIDFLVLQIPRRGSQRFNRATEDGARVVRVPFFGGRW